VRIFDEEADKAISMVTLFLTKSEASELRDKLEALLARNGQGHEHVPSEDFQKEITLAIYGDDGLSQFDQRSQRLIREDR
jgi:hypothetical protein